MNRDSLKNILNDSVFSPTGRKVQNWWEVLDDIPELQNVYITMTHLQKVGINPQSRYNTPNGIYCYPASFVKESGGKLPFQSDAPWVNILRTKNPDKIAHIRQGVVQVAGELISDVHSLLKLKTGNYYIIKGDDERSPILAREDNYEFYDIPYMQELKDVFYKYYSLYKGIYDTVETFTPPAGTDRISYWVKTLKDMTSDDYTPAEKESISAVLIRVIDNAPLNNINPNTLRHFRNILYNLNFADVLFYFKQQLDKEGIDLAYTDEQKPEVENEVKISPFSVFITQVYEHSKNFPISGFFWAATWKLSQIMASLSGRNIDKSAPNIWNKLLREMGIEGVVDHGTGTIHPNEPTQAVFLSKVYVKVIDRIENTTKRTSNEGSKLAEYLETIQTMIQTGDDANPIKIKLTNVCNKIKHFLDPSQINYLVSKFLGRLVEFYKIEPEDAVFWFEFFIQKMKVESVEEYLIRDIFLESSKQIVLAKILVDSEYLTQQEFYINTAYQLIMACDINTYGNSITRLKNIEFFKLYLQLMQKNPENIEKHPEMERYIIDAESL